MTELRTALADAVTGAFAPLDDALRDADAMRSLVFAAGLTPPPFTDAILAEVATVLDLAADLATLVDAVDRGLDRLGPGEIESVIAAGKGVAQGVVALTDGSLVGALSTAAAEMPEPWADPQLVNDVLLAVVDHLVLRWLRGSAPLVVALGRGLGVIGVRGGRAVDRVDWRAAADLLADPSGTARSAFGWGAGFDTAHLERVLRAVGDLLWLHIDAAPATGPLVEHHWPDGAPRSVRLYDLPLVSESLAGDLASLDAQLAAGARLDAGLQLLPIQDPAADDGVIAGVVVAPRAAAGGAVALELGDGWALVLDAPATPAGETGVALLPDGDGGVSATVTSATADLGLSVSVTGEPAWSLGDGGVSLDLTAVAITGGIRGAGDAAEPFVVLSLGDPTNSAIPDGLTLTIGDPDADGFLSWFMGGSVVVGADVEIDVSPSGIRIAGGLGLTISIPIDRTIGPIAVDRLDLAVGTSLGVDPGARFEATVTGSVVLGPIAFAADRLGLALTAEEAADGDGLVGPIDVSLGFVPPTAFGAAVDAGVVSGGGYVEVAPPRYSGVLDIDILGVGVTVIGIVSTEPAGATATSDFSVFLSILTEFTPIPLGFGFTLNGVGGIAAVNRTMDIEALADGVIAGDLDHILYPDDPIADAPAILAGIDAWFPEADGQTTFGPVVRIGWGTPTLVTIDLGVFIAFPDLAIAVVGQVAAALPDESVKLISFQASMVGAVDVAAGTVLAVATIEDAQVVGIALAGSAGFYIDTGSSPFFMLSVGGTHPEWAAPAGVPSAMTDLEPLTASIPLSPIVDVQVEGYLAVTSNTVQFGGGIWVSASTEFLFTTYYAEGWFEAHVLITFSPLRVKATLSAGIEVRTKKKSLAGVTFTVKFEGPRPWYASGEATFDFFGLEVTFPVEVGSRAGSEVPDSHPVGADLAAALADPASWQTMASGALSGVHHRQAAIDTGVTTPDHRIEVRQQVVPLGITIDHFGPLAVAGDDRFDVTEAGIGSIGEWSMVTDYFAPAVFTDLKKKDKLSAPSFEEYDAGVSLVADAVVPTDEADVTSVAIAHEEREVNGDAPPVSVPLRSDRLELRTNRAAVAPLRAGLGTTRSVVAPVLEVAPRAFATVTVTGTVVAHGTFASAAKERPDDVVVAGAVATSGAARDVVLAAGAVR